MSEIRRQEREQQRQFLRHRLIQHWEQEAHNLLANLSLINQSNTITNRRAQTDSGSGTSSNLHHYTHNGTTEWLRGVQQSHNQQQNLDMIQRSIDRELNGAQQEIGQMLGEVNHYCPIAVLNYK